MEYEKGCVIKLKNIRFKETDKLDFRMNGHPVIVPIEIKDSEEIYFFTSSSQIRLYSTEKSRYYLTGELPHCGLPAKCLIDLKHVYKWQNKNYVPKSPIPHEQLEKLMKKATEYENKNLDSDYLEFLEKIS